MGKKDLKESIWPGRGTQMDGKSVQIRNYMIEYRSADSHSHRNKMIGMGSPHGENGR
jgi:hypothetical protein